MMGGVWLAVLLGVGSGVQSGQGFGQIDLGQSQVPVRARQNVAYAAEEQVVKAGRPAVLELRFAVQDGFHVNSHRPKSELVTPTGLELGAAAGVTVGKVEFPAGKSFLVAGETMDVYAGEFTVKVPVTAAAGAHEVSGTLVYQACDRAVCYPVKKLPVTVMITAR